MKKHIFLSGTASGKLDRRTFIRQSILAGSSLLVFSHCTKDQGNPALKGNILEQGALLGGLNTAEGPHYLPGAQWYEGRYAGDGLSYNFPAGSLASELYIATDMLAEGNHMIKFQIILQEGEDGPAFKFEYGVLNQCSLRVRLPLSLTDQNRWGIDREGSFLKPRCGGDRVDLQKVDRMRLVILRKSDQPARFCLTPVLSSAEEVPLISHPVLPNGKLIDDIGQSTIHDWPSKTKDADEMKQYLQNRLKEADHTLPETMSEWGGWKDKRLLEGSGYFRVHHDGKRWWLIDPSGYYFWSSGMDCVRVDTTADYYLLEDALTWIPSEEGEYADIFSERGIHPSINYLAANFIRTFGMEGWRDKWATVALDELKRLRINTVGNWSEWEYASRSKFPYVRPMSFAPKRVNNIYRDFPDVYHEDFEKDALDYAQVLSDTKDDPALIGYFMMNEPTWAFSSELPAVGMLYNTPSCVTRGELRRYLEEKYGDDTRLSDSWKMKVTLDQVETGKWKDRFTENALTDLEAFSQVMVERYFSILSRSCREVDPNHLNLGIRYAGIPPNWAVEGMRSFDVFSMNNYREKVPLDVTGEIHKLLGMPVIIGEWHFGALDAGLPSSGIGHVHTQADRGKAYRIYIEDAAANPYCIGTHWFTLYDQSALGRFDGENYNIGFLDVCNRPHVPLCDAAIQSHENIYRIASGELAPYEDAPEYLPMLF
ncbi:MAG: hypothetical protein KFF73_18650 [Cyclobacteriaceae bacterium]|nr:hypothetical protein [Cyclobacteriaceae bacterium]